MCIMLMITMKILNFLDCTMLFTQVNPNHDTFIEDIIYSFTIRLTSTIPLLLYYL